jgi:hypothetical protein
MCAKESRVINNVEELEDMDIDIDAQSPTSSPRSPIYPTSSPNTSHDVEMMKLFHQNGHHLANEMNGKHWTKEMAINLRNYAWDAYKYAWQTGEDAYYWNSYNSKMTKYASILSLIVSAAFAGNLSNRYVDDEGWKIFTEIIGWVGFIISLAVSIVTTLLSVNNVVTKITEHSEKSAKFGRLYRRISNQFSMPLSIRYNAQTLLDFVSSRFDELDSEKLFVRKTTEEKWSQLEEKGDFSIEEALSLPIEFYQNEDLDYDMSDGYRHISPSGVNRDGESLHSRRTYMSQKRRISNEGQCGEKKWRKKDGYKGRQEKRKITSHPEDYV